MEKRNEGREVVLITGSSGLLGSALTRALSGDYEVVGIDLDPPRDSIADSHRCDLTDSERLQEVMQKIRREHGDRIASVVHLAAYYDFRGEPSPLYDELTVGGTVTLLELLQDFDVGQFVFSSTLLVMRPSEDREPLTEDSPLEAAWEYPESKIRAEAAIDEHRGEIPAVVLRVAGVYDEDGHSPPIANQIHRIHAKEFESYFFPGDATRGQSFVHLDDAIEAIRLAIEKRDKLDDQEVFLIGEFEVMSYESLQAAIGKLLHDEEWPSVRIPKPVAKAGAWVKNALCSDDNEFIKPWMIDLADAHYPVRADRARDRLGWKPRHSLRGCLPEMVERLKNDPQRWYEANGIEAPEIAASQTG